MTPRPLLLLLLLLPLAAATGCNEDAPERSRCAQCGMYVDMAPRWMAGARDASGEEVLFDSPKCMLRWLHGDRGTGARQAWVTEYYTQTRRPTTGIVFVVGSDLTSPMGADLVPVGDAETAARFVEDHGGRPIPASEVDDAVLRGLEAP